MGNAIPNRNQTPWNNTDTRASHRTFSEPTHNHQISIHEMGGVGAFDDFAERLGNMWDLKHEAGLGDDITELKSLIRGQSISINSAGNSENFGFFVGGFRKTPIYGKEKKSDTDLK